MIKVKSDDVYDCWVNVVFKLVFCYVYNIVKLKLVLDLIKLFF